LGATGDERAIGLGGRVQFALGTFSIGDRSPFAGLVLDGKVFALSGLERLFHQLQLELSGADSVLSLLENWDNNLTALERAAELLRDGRPTKGPEQAAFVAVDQLKLHPPVKLPRQIFCSGANYRKHVIDLIVDHAGPDTKGMTTEERRDYATKMMDERAARGAPYFFSKAPSAVTGPCDPIILPRNSQQPDWELELAVVIGRAARHVRRDDALSYVAGYTIANDITNRDLASRSDLKALGIDWVRGKCMPSFLPMGPYLVPAAFVGDPQNLQITLKLNGQVMQDESTADMIFDVTRLIEDLSSYIQLWPGDLIVTGSPSGNGTHYNRYLRPGDVVESSITGLGTQRNECVAESIF
jgi:2,4-diketo-3-deoxy-L-fuconate hydrolase